MFVSKKGNYFFKVLKQQKTTIEELIQRNRTEKKESSQEKSSGSSLNTVEEKHSVKVKRETNEERLLQPDQIEERLVSFFFESFLE